MKPQSLAPRGSFVSFYTAANPLPPPPPPSSRPKVGLPSLVVRKEQHCQKNPLQKLQITGSFLSELGMQQQCRDKMNTGQKNGLKMAVSLDFFGNFFRESNPPRPLINRLKWFCLNIRFAEIFEIFKFEKFYSTLFQPARSQMFLTSQPFKNLTIMLGYVEIVPMLIFLFLSRQGESCKNKIDAGTTPRNVSLHRVRLRAFLVTLGFSRNLIH